MNIKNVIKICVSIVFIMLSLFFILCLQLPEIKRAKFEEAKKIIIQIDKDLKNSSLNEYYFKSISNDFFYAVWVKEKTGDYLPAVFNRKYLKENELSIWFNEINKSDNIYELFPGNTPYVINDRQYIMWINKYNIDYIIKYIVLALLFLILVYLIFIAAIELIFSGKTVHEFESNVFHQEDASSEEEDTIYKDGSKNEILSGYRELWMKNFKISEDFKNNFPMDKINGLIRIAVVPSTFIRESLEFATDYFRWKNPKIYIRQNSIYIDAVTKDILEESKVSMPLDGNQKGPIFIPLFPFNADEIYGYLYYEWDKDNKFFIADILYFLKYLFSEKSKNIFLCHNELERILSVMESKLEKDREIGVALLQADNCEKIKSELKKDWMEKLNGSIRDRLIESFNKEIIFLYNDLTFFIISENADKNKFVLDIEKWINNVDLQFYDVSNEYGSIALSYSCGVSFKSNRNIHPLSLIMEAEDNLAKAVQKGRNEVVY